MEKQYSPTTKEKKVMQKEKKLIEKPKKENVKEVKEEKQKFEEDTKKDNLTEEGKIEENSGEKTQTSEEKNESLSNETKKAEKKELKKKEFAIVNGRNLRISTKHAKYICKMIKNKKIDDAIEIMEEVIEKKRAVPMYGREIPHRKGMMSGRYPINASKEILLLLKQLKANSFIAGIDNPIIFKAIPNIASRPYRKEGRKAKRTHVYLEARELNLIKKV